MVRRARSGLTLLALLTASGVLSANIGLTPVATTRLTALKGQEPARARQVAQAVELSKFDLGLGALDSVKPTIPFTDAYGRTHVRLKQTYRGVEVWNTSLIGHMDAEGNLLPTHATVSKGIDLQPTRLMGEAKAKNITEDLLTQPGERPRLLPMTVTPIVFPTRLQAGTRYGRDAEGNFVPVPKYSVSTPRKQAPFVWAYHVRATQLQNGLPEATDFILDARTGEVLDKWDGAAHADSPVVGTGKGQYCGNVALNTTQLTDPATPANLLNKFTLQDATRGSKPHPYSDPGGPFNYPEFGGLGCQAITYDASQNIPGEISPMGYKYFKDTNTWGNGERFIPLEPPTSTTGETAAVDALYHVGKVWDYTKNILGRDGVDNQGTSIVTVVHERQGMMNPDSAWNVAQYMTGGEHMILGDGGKTGANTNLETIAHEMAHGVQYYQANLSWWPYGGGEGSAVNEANSDIHATMAKYYVWGADGQGTVIPNTLPAGHTLEEVWSYNRKDDDAAPNQRHLYKPSLDGGYDAWFQGMDMDVAHFKAGPAERAFFFLSQGATPSGDTSSLYLPSGMTGLGNDKALRIWYNAMATKVTQGFDTTYHTFRASMLESASELFPGAGSADSPEMAAVKNAFAAINVGVAADGKVPVQVSITLPDVKGSNTLFYAPIYMPVELPEVTVTGTTNTAVTWSKGGMSANSPAYAGKFLEDGRYMAYWMSRWPIKATSVADPRFFAVTNVCGVSLDCDLDTDQDACDLGAVALTMLYTGVYPAGDIDFAYFAAAFNNAFNK